MKRFAAPPLAPFDGVAPSARAAHSRTARVGLGQAARVALLLSLSLAALCPAWAQWKWRDASGSIQYSDRPPPSGTPDSQILGRPSLNSRVARMAASASAATSAAAPAGASKSLDDDVAAKRRKDQEAKDAKQKEMEEENARLRAQACEDARTNARTLQSNMRIMQVNEKGEREYLSDSQRADQIQQAEQAQAQNCH